MRKRPFRILIVEDDPDDSLLLDVELRTRPDLFLATTITNHHELTNYLQTNNDDQHHAIESIPQVIFLSAFSQQFTLPETLALLENHPALKGIPVIIIVNSDLEVEFVSSNYPGNIYGFLVKPISIEKIIGLLATC